MTVSNLLCSWGNSIHHDSLGGSAKEVKAVETLAVAAKEKPFLFEEGLDYIITAKRITSKLVKEVLDLETSSCSAYRRFKIDSGFFSPKGIARETTYYLIICYLKHQVSAGVKFSDGYVPKGNEVTAWLEKVLGSNNIVNVPTPFLNEVSIKNQQVYFNDKSFTFFNSRYSYTKFPPLKLAKLVPDFSEANFRYTSKKEKLGVKEVFHNQIYETGRCLGAVNNALEEFVLAYSYDKAKRNIAKSNFVKSLELKDIWPLLDGIALFIRDYVLLRASLGSKLAKSILTKDIKERIYNEDVKSNFLAVKEKFKAVVDKQIYEEALDIDDILVCDFIDELAQEFKEASIPVNIIKVRLFNKIAKGAGLIKNSLTEFTINHCEKDFSANGQLNLAFEVFTSVNQSACDLMDMLAKIQANKIKRVYARLRLTVLEYSHAMALTIIAVGQGFKFITYDPNDAKLYGHMFIHGDDIGPARLEKLINCYSYLEKHRCVDARMLIQGYVPKSEHKINPEVICKRIISVTASQSQIDQLIGLTLLSGNCNSLNRIINGLSKAGKNVDLKFDFAGDSPLTMMVAMDNIEMVKMLLKHGADVNYLSKSGFSPLYAALKGYTKFDILKLLLKHGAQVDNKHPKYNPLDLVKEKPYVEKLISSYQ